MADNEPSCGKPGQQLRGILERESRKNQIHEEAEAEELTAPTLTEEHSLRGKSHQKF